MTLESPSTYAEWFFKHQIDASKQFADDSEAFITPFIASLLNEIPIVDEMPDGIKSFIEAVKAPQSFAFLPFMAGLGINALDEALDTAFSHIITMLRRTYNRRSRETWLTSEQVNTLWSRKKITEGLWNETTASEGYEDVLASSLYEAQLPYPSIPDVIAYSRYHDDPQNPWSTFQEWWNISPREWPLWNWLGKQRLNTEQVTTLFKRGLLGEGEMLDILSRIGWDSYDRDYQKDLTYSIPNAMLLVQGGLLQESDNNTIIEAISKADIHPNYANVYYDAILTKPPTEDVISYELRKDPALPNLDRELRKIGIHPNYNNLYKELAYQIPPIADIITMAVREAFTPEIAARFGQYEDLPPAFVEWAQKKGLRKEWAERYWAAHWSLPSPQQGFEMLQRGVITREDLELLLRALDIMPFWRDKLIQISYNPLTRVDVRRMYRLGVLDETGVTKAYKDAGYSEENAKLMTEFTTKHVRQSLSRFTPANVISAYTKRFIDAGTARIRLTEIGIKRDEIDYIIGTADYKREWAVKQERIDAIENLYKKGRLTERQTVDELERLTLPSDHINTLIQQWQAKVEVAKVATWTAAQTLKFLRQELISVDRAKAELILLGYNTERISVYLASAKPPPS